MGIVDTQINNKGGDVLLDSLSDAMDSIFMAHHMVYRTNPKAAEELVRISNELRLVLDHLFPSTNYNTASVARFICDIDNTSEMIETCKLQPKTDTNFEPNGPSADMEGDSENKDGSYEDSSNEAKTPDAEKMPSWSRNTVVSSKYKKAGPFDRLMVSSTTAEDVAGSKSLRQHFKPSRTKHLQQKQLEKSSSTTELGEQPTQTCRERDL
ncbi:hypothetical protein MMC29_007826 [Sticta canariensis]|nr:hypothetical protein [Sticta canariensis]